MKKNKSMLDWVPVCVKQSTQVRVWQRLATNGTSKKSQSVSSWNRSYDAETIDPVDVKPIGSYQDVINGQNVTVTVYPKVDPRPTKWKLIHPVHISGIYPARVTHASRNDELQNVLLS